MRSKLLFIFVAALYAGSAALAQSLAASADQHFAKLDKNRDGVISRDEAAGHPSLADDFDAIDGDKNGKLSREELQAARQEHRNRPLSRFDEQFKAADKDGDGGLTRPEADAAGLDRIVKHFNRLDGDRDGKITRDELRAVVRIGLPR
jgi:Ca2+-binding EF-hand superfamily protein